MNKDDTLRSEKGAPEDRKNAPSVVVGIITALAAALAAAVFFEFGLVCAVVLSATVIFLVSSGSHLALAALPLAGIGFAYTRGGLWILGITGAVWLASVFAGLVIRRGGDFHRSLMTYLLVGCFCATVGGVLFFKGYGITVEQVADALKVYVHDALAMVIESAAGAPGAIQLEEARLFAEQYEAIAAAAVIYIPAVIGMGIALCGIISLRIAGFFHTLTGCETYPIIHRLATPDRIFAVIYLAALFLGLLDTGALGICASNIMLILMLPAAAAGVSAYRFLTVRHRLMGKRGIPFSLIVLIFSFLFFTPAVGVMILSLVGCLQSFKKKNILVIKKK